MRIHHLNCGTDCPVGGALMDGRSRTALGHLVCHCLLIETNVGLVLIDTGYGLRDVKDPHPRLSRAFRTLLNIRFRESETAIRQIEALGFSAEDVRHIVLTHLDFAHAGGIEDFPRATVHVMRKERDATRRRSDFVARGRYRPRQWDEVSDWRTYDTTGDSWLGFDAVRDLHGLPPEILLVPLYGHSWGHAGVAVEGDDGWLLHAGDAYFHHKEVRGPTRQCPLGLRAYQRLMEVNRTARLHNQDRLRLLANDRTAGVRLICAHDVLEYEECLPGGRASPDRHPSESWDPTSF